MAKTVKTRIQNKHDSEANWNNASFAPFAGEIIIYDADENHAQPRIKIGDGVTPVTKLPFCTGITMEQEGTDSIPFIPMAHISSGSEVFN